MPEIHPIPPPKPPTPPVKPPLETSGTDTGSQPGDEEPPETTTIVTPLVIPPGRPTKKRILVVAGPVGDGGGGRGSLATEPLTFEVVEAFERYQGRFIVRVSHLRGLEGFGCDLLSVASEAIRDRARADQSITEADILRYIEVKGRSSRTGEVELTENEYRAAKRLVDRYWLYRVFVDPDRESHYEVAVLCDPLKSKAVHTVARLRLAEGSGALWYSLVEKTEEEPRANEGKSEGADPGVWIDGGGEKAHH
jgi:hypothetical protein